MKKHWLVLVCCCGLAAASIGISINSSGVFYTPVSKNLHMLRGTFATRCAEAKIAPAVLKKILGHTDITVTMKYYVDVDVEFEKAENKNVEDYLIDKEIFNVDSDYDYDYA